jgi:hypothetical protein
MDILIDESIEYQLFEVAHKPAIYQYYIAHRGTVLEVDNDLERLLDIIDLAQQQDCDLLGFPLYT